MTETPIMAISILPFPVCKITISCDFMTFLAQYYSIYCVFVQGQFNKIETAQPFRLGGSELLSVDDPANLPGVQIFHCGQF